MVLNLTKPVCGKQALGVNLCHILENLIQQFRHDALFCAVDVQSFCKPRVIFLISPVFSDYDIRFVFWIIKL